MNKVILMGRLTRDPEVRYSQNGDSNMAIARFSLAVDRRFTRKDNPDQTADFINCVAFGKLGEHVEKYYHKGLKVAVTGRIQTGSYTNKEGQKVYTTEVVVEEAEFAESKNAAGASGGNGGGNFGGGAGYNNAGPAPDDDNFMNIADGIDDEMPFGN